MTARVGAHLRAARNSAFRLVFLSALVLAAAAPCHAAPPRSAACTRVELTGKVNAGEEWKAPIGEGWVLRVIPIVPGPAGYTGWDLVVDRDPPAGFPDALLLATPPYNSINEREIGVTYGLRAQDAVGWNPRSFHFLTDPGAFREGQTLFLALLKQLQAQSAASPGASANPGSDPAVARLTRRLIALQAHPASGQLRILEAGLTPGAADPAPFAQNWALAAARMPIALVPPADAKPTPLGQLHWIRFSITLWLPAGWQLPRGLASAPAPCSP